VREPRYLRWGLAGERNAETQKQVSAHCSSRFP
jgi:hypothetical protein